MQPRRSAAFRGEYLFVWAGDSAGASSDFLGVIDASPSSPTYGSVVASLPTGVVGTHPHHTEAVLAANNHLLANGFHAGRTWLFDLSTPRAPKILTSFGDLGGFSHPHTYVRLPNGNILATFQYERSKGDSVMPASSNTGSHTHDMADSDGEHTTGGLVEMDERGTVIRASAARDSAIPDGYIYPYSVLPIPALDRALSTTTDMDEADRKATSQWGKPRAVFVKGFEGKNCGVPLLAGHYWLQTVPDAHALVSLDIADPEHPNEVATLKLGDDEQPHWIAIDNTGRRIALNSAGAGTGNRLFIIDFDPASGALKLDERFRDAGSARPGVSFSEDVASRFHRQSRSARHGVLALIDSRMRADLDTAPARAVTT